MTRIYPIRTCRSHWKIKIYCYHTCSDRWCSRIMLSCSDDDPNQFRLIPNPNYIDGKCSKYNKLEKTFIRLFNFDKTIPRNEFGLLYNPDAIVIPDTSFSVSLFFPFSHVFDISINSYTSFTLRDLLHSIKVLYTFIYDEEERTATPQTYTLKRVCNDCSQRRLSDCSSTTDPDIVKSLHDTNKECSICYNSFISEEEDNEEEQRCITLKCKHIFHEECLSRWVQSSATCPLCRLNIFECEKCVGTGIVYYTFNGVVIPVEERGEMLNRNSSNGIFGIHSYDLEDIILEDMLYDRKRKKLYLNLSA